MELFDFGETFRGAERVIYNKNKVVLSAYEKSAIRLLVLIYISFTALSIFSIEISEKIVAPKCTYCYT